MNDRPLRILHLVNRWEQGGTRSHISTLSREQKRMGHDVWVAGHVVASAGRADDPALTHLRLYPAGSTQPSPLAMLRAAVFLRSLCRRKGIDILHMHGRLVTPLGAMVVKGLRTARVYTGHDLHSDRMMLARFPRHVICPGETARASFLKSATGGEHDIRIIPHGVGDEFYFVADEESPAEGDRVVAFIGRHVAVKGGEVLIDAVHQLTQSWQTPFHVLFCGDGDARSRWMDRTRKDGVEECVRFLPDADVTDILRASGCVVVPSVGEEAFGLVIAEACAARRTVIASDLPAYRELIEDGRNGLLFPPGDSAALSACLKKVLDDRSYALMLARNARADAETRFRASRMARATLEVYRDAIDPHRRPRG